MQRLKSTSGKDGALGILAGVIAGMAAGIWLRIMMRLVALTVAPATAMIQDPEGNLVNSPVPVFTLEGSLSVVFFPMVVGFFLGFVLFVLRTVWPVISKYRGTLFGALLLAMPGVPLLMSTSELSIGPAGFGAILFALTPFVFGWAFEGCLRLVSRGP